jgi:hypothetical protein
MSVAFADRTFIVYFSLSPSIHLFPRFQANSHIREEYACTYARTFCPTSWFCDLSTLSYHDVEGRQRGARKGSSGARGSTVESDCSLSLSIIFAIFNIIMLAYPLLTQVTADRETHPHTHRRRSGQQESVGVGQDRLQVRDEQGWGKQRVLPVYGRPPMRLMRVLFHTPKTVL